MNSIQNRIMFKVKKGYYLKLVTPATIKLLGSTKNKIKKWRKCSLFRNCETSINAL